MQVSLAQLKAATTKELQPKDMAGASAPVHALHGVARCLGGLSALQKLTLNFANCSKLGNVDVLQRLVGRNALQLSLIHI